MHGEENVQAHYSHRWKRMPMYKVYHVYVIDEWIEFKW